MGTTIPDPLEAEASAEIATFSETDGTRECSLTVRPRTMCLPTSRSTWPQLRSTNPLERLNGEIKRRAYVVATRSMDQSNVGDIAESGSRRGTLGAP